MSIFCDTSALLKLYVEELGSDRVQEHVARAGPLIVCRITWAEAWAAFARKSREGLDHLAPLRRSRDLFCQHWPEWNVVDMTQDLVESAGSLAEAFILRGYDSVQLAAAISVHVMAPPVTFASFDTRLNRAARVLGMDAPFTD